MKTRILFCLLIVMILPGCTSKKTSPMEGAWQVVSWERTAGDSLMWKFPGSFTGSEIKIWSEGYYSFAGRYKTDTAFVDNCGGGTYRIEGNHYEENVLYFPDQKVVGTTLRLLLEIHNDTLTQTWPVDENWQVIKSEYNIQKLKRLD